MMTTLAWAPANNLDKPNTEKNAALKATAPALIAMMYGKVLLFIKSIIDPQTLRQ